MIRVTGIVEANATIAKIEKMVIDTELSTVAVAVKQAGLTVERAAKENIRGRHQVGTPRPNQESGDGTLMNVTGALRRSISTSTPRRIGFGEYMVEVGPTLIYGRIQELGSESKGIPARPYMAPALRESRAKIYEIYRQVWNRSTH